MRYRSLPAFERSLRKLDSPRKARVKSAIEQLVAFFETGHLPAGLGLKRLHQDLWEVRAGLSDRVILRRAGDLIEFIIVGTHDEIRRFLKRV